MATLRKRFLSIFFISPSFLYGLIAALYFALSLTALHARPLLTELTLTEATVWPNELLKPPKPTKTKHPPKPTDTPTATLATSTTIDTPTPFPVTAPPVTATNTPVPPTATPVPLSTAIDTPTPTEADAQVVLIKTDFLFNDMDSNNLVSPGDKLLYVITISNKGQRAAQQLRLVDTLDANTLLVVGTVKTDQGRIVQGNNLNDARVVFEMDDLAPHARVTLSFQVSIKLSVNDTQVQNQAMVAFVNAVGGPAGQMVVISDDPDSPAPLDATVTPLNGNPIRPQPKLFLPFVSRKN